MASVLIENPVLNSPFSEPARHFRTTADGEFTGEIEERRRPRGAAVVDQDEVKAVAFVQGVSRAVIVMSDARPERAHVLEPDMEPWLVGQSVTGDTDPVAPAW